MVAQETVQVFIYIFRLLCIYVDYIFEKRPTRIWNCICETGPIIKKWWRERWYRSLYI